MPMTIAPTLDDCQHQLKPTPVPRKLPAETEGLVTWIARALGCSAMTSDREQAEGTETEQDDSRGLGHPRRNLKGDIQV
jgi:hypothetical protein